MKKYWIWLLAGCAAAVPGVLAWVLVVYSSGYQVFLIAIAIGVLSGLGVRAAAREVWGGGPAAVALLAALIMMGAAKVGHIVASFPTDRAANARETLLGVVSREVERAGGTVEVRSFGWEHQYPQEIQDEADRRWNALSPEERSWYLAGPAHAKLLDRESVITGLAIEIAEESIAQGTALDWPPDADRLDPAGRDDFPTDVWERAVARWQAFSPEERRAYEEHAVEVFFRNLILVHVFTTLSFWDLFFFPMAAGGAFLVGFGFPAPRARRVAFGCSVAGLGLLAVGTWLVMRFAAEIREEAFAGQNPPGLSESRKPE